MLISTSLLFSNCKDNQLPAADHQEKASSPYGEIIPYQLDGPTQSFTLPRDLREISGLTYFPSKKSLFAINDEKGRAFLLSPETGKIDGHITFGKPNDYEGITYHEGMVYIVESNGDLI